MNGGVKELWSRWRRCLLGEDKGSGTMVGMGLVAAAAVLLAMAASVGNLMVCQARARSAADLTALSSAAVLWHTQGDACAAAGTIADRHGGRLASCRVDGEDVVVTVAIPTRVPFAGEVSERAAAGPVECE